MERYDGNVVPFASESEIYERTVFGDTVESDDINDNINADFKRGWRGAVGLNDKPPVQWFNALGYTQTALTSYLYQMGIAEWNDKQEYKINSIAIGTDGNIYQSLVDSNIGNALTDTTKWVCIASKNSIVNSISELKTISNIESINVLGYYEKGDGGGGLFYWNATSTESDNGGTIIQATGVTTGRWRRVFSGAINVKWFGAKINVDSTESIQKALNSNISIKGNIEEKFLISDTLSISPRDNYKIEDLSLIATGSNFNETKYLLDFVGNASNFSFNFCTINNLFINLKNIASGIKISKPQTCLFNNLKIIHRHSSGKSFYQAGNSADLRINNSFIGGHYFDSPDNGGGGTTAYYNGTDVHFEGADNKISNTTVVSDNVPLTYTKYMTGTYPKTVQFDSGGCSFDHSHCYNGLMVIDSKNQQITNSYFGNNAIKMIYPYSNNISNNVFFRENLSDYVSTSDWFIAIEPPAPNTEWYLANVAIANNNFTNDHSSVMRPIQRWGTVPITKVKESIMNNAYTGNCLATKLSHTLRYTAAGNTLNHTFDFSDVILFGEIWSYHISYSVEAGGPPSPICVSGIPTINNVFVHFATNVSNPDFICTVDVNEPY